MESLRVDLFSGLVEHFDRLDRTGLCREENGFRVGGVHIHDLGAVVVVQLEDARRDRHARRGSDTLVTFHDDF